MMGGESAYTMQSYNDYDMYEEPDKMTYTEQANKRGNCRRLSRYVQFPNQREDAFISTGNILASKIAILLCRTREDFVTIAKLTH